MSQYLSLRKGEIVEVEESLANELIASGLASEYKLLEPEGKLPIKKATEYDCGAYATAQVEDANLTAEKIKKNTTILGVRGTYESELSSIAITNQTGDSVGITHLTVLNGKVQTNYVSVANGSTATIYCSFETGTSTANSNLRIFLMRSTKTAINVTNGEVLVAPNVSSPSNGISYPYWIRATIGATEMTLSDGEQQET